MLFSTVSNSVDVLYHNIAVKANLTLTQLNVPKEMFKSQMGNIPLNIKNKSM